MNSGEAKNQQFGIESISSHFPKDRAEFNSPERISTSPKILCPLVKQRQDCKACLGSTSRPHVINQARAAVLKI